MIIEVKASRNGIHLVYILYASSICTMYIGDSTRKQQQSILANEVKMNNNHKEEWV